MGHEDESPHKVAAIKKYLSAAFPGHEIRHFYEPGPDWQSFRIEGAGFGRTSLSEEYFFDLPDDEGGITGRLTEARLPHAIRESNEKMRIVLTWDEDEKRRGLPRVRMEPLDPGKKPRSSP